MTTITAPYPPTATTAPRASSAAGRLFVDFLLLLFMVANMAWSMQAAQWSPGLEQLFPVVLLAVTAGTLVALSGFSRWFTLTYSVAVGAAGILASMAPLSPTVLTGQERVYHILDRAYIWFHQAIAGEPIADNLIFVLIMCLVVYVIAFSATWTYFREGRKWQAVLPTGLAMLVNLYYAPPRLSAYFIIYVLCAILLLVRATLAEREAEWYQARVYFPFDISFDFMRDGVLFALFVIVTSWVLPSAATEGQLSAMMQPLEKPWNEFKLEWERLFSTMNYGRAVGAPGFGTSLSLGGPRTVTNEPVMDVRTPVNRYYRAVVVDTYLPGGWILQQPVGMRLTNNDDIRLANWPARREITQTVTVYQPGNVLVAAPQPVDARIPSDARVIVNQTQVEATQGAATDMELAMMVSRRTLNQGDNYVVVSSIPTVSIAQLRNDHTTYPDYVTERYLQLPNTIPQRVFDLADDLAAGMDNPYDIVKQIESFLRGFTYNDQIPGPTPGQDGVDYFLFEEQQGYCNYYASALAVMLRHLGIPTRLAIGYATGEFQPDLGVYRLRDSDQHTWVEVYFPTYGWIEFEPTASEPVVSRPAGGEDEDGTGGAGASTPPGSALDRDLPIPDDLGDFGATDSGFGESPVDQVGGALLLLASLAGIVLVVLWGSRRLRRPQERRHPVLRAVPRGFAARLWERLLAWGNRLGLLTSPTLTPLEQASSFGAAVPEGAAGIQTIAQLYARDVYSPHEITIREASDAQLSWMELRPILLRQWLNQRLRVPAGLKRSLFVRRGGD